MVIGIDFGSSATKIVLMDRDRVVERFRISRKNSYEDVIKNFDLSKVTKIVTVGTGASYIEENILGIDTVNVDEFKAVAKGGLYLSGYEECIVASVGTGTSIEYVNKDEVVHLGGCGIGGGLLNALAVYGLHMEDVVEFMNLALKGKREDTDVLIKDISKTQIGTLIGNATVANMAKIKSDSKPEDYAYGVCNMVFQNVGVMAVMADKPYNSKKIVAMGSICISEISKRCFAEVAEFFGFDIFVPEDSIYGVAIGAVKCAE